MATRQDPKIPIDPGPEGPWLAAAGWATLSGVLWFLAFPGFGFHPLGWFAFVPLLIALERASLKRAFLLGWLTGFVSCLGGFYWSVILVRDFGELPLAVAIVSYLLLSAGTGLSCGVFSAVLHLGRLPDGRALSWWAPALLFAAVEYAWWSVFPAYFGAILVPLPALIQAADVTGVVGCTSVLLLANGAIYECTRAFRNQPNRWRSAVLICAGTLAVWSAYGAIRLGSTNRLISAAPKLRVGMVQTNIGAMDKRTAGREEVGVYHAMTRELDGKVDLIVWPESSYPFPVPLGATNVSRAVGPLQTPIALGVLMVDEPRAYGTALLAAPRGEVLGTSHKVYRIPFGEYLPFGETFPVLYKWIPGAGNLSPGQEPRVLAFTTSDGLDVRLGPIICYEDILAAFTRFVSRHTQSNVLINLTNDSWYGDSTEPAQHLALAQFRSVELRQPMIRSTNTGISALIDPAGRLIARSGQWTKENVIGEVPVLSSPPTIYYRFGDWYAWLCLLFAASALFFGIRYRIKERQL